MECRKMPPFEVNGRMESFHGWHLDKDEGILYDPDGNRYTPPRVRSSLETLEIANALLGTPLQVTSLKQRLLERLKPIRLIVEMEIENGSVKITRTETINGKS